MKYESRKASAFAALIILSLAAVSAMGQGSLTPPGAPGATMKTLDQVEPRIPISGGAYAITRPGSYYLTTNNSSGITIQTGNVTVDLMGYALAAVGGSAVYFYGAYTNVVIRNGTISSDIGNGVNCGYASANARGLIERVRIQNCAVTGLLLPAGFIVRDCEIYGCGTGIQASGAIDVLNCRLESNGTGLSLTGGCRVIRNTIINNAGGGIRLTGAGSYVAENIVKGNGDNYDLAAGNQLNLLLCEIPESLDRPCSVKLAGTLTCTLASTDGITVNADDVTIDLAGHALVGPGANSGSGISQSSARRNLSVFNGKTVNWRGHSVGGIQASGPGCRISGIQAASNFYGIVAGDISTLNACDAHHNVSWGLGVGDSSAVSLSSATSNGAGIYVGDRSTVSQCSAMLNDTGISAGVGCLLSECLAHQNSYAGIDAVFGCVLSRCSASENGSYGISADGGCTLSDCVAQSNAEVGMMISYGCRVTSCTVTDNGPYVDGSGFYVYGNDNQIEGCQADYNGCGVDVYSTGNFIARNKVHGNAANWSVPAGNVCLVVQAAKTTGAISGDAGGTAPGSTDPNANFTY